MRSRRSPAWTPCLLGVALLSVGATASGQAGNGSTPRVAINYMDPREAMERGGLLMWPILVCSIAMLTFGLERWIKLRRGRIIPTTFIRKFLVETRDGEMSQRRAIETLKANGSPMANILLTIAKAWGRPASELEKAAGDAGEREIVLLKSHLRALPTTANLATLLGLLGTIVGMIQAFNNVAVHKGLGRAEVLADGIAQALLTTAFGLVVAIPALALHAWFVGRVERLAQDMDHLSLLFIEMVSAEGPPKGSKASTGPLEDDLPLARRQTAPIRS